MNKKQKIYLFSGIGLAVIALGYYGYTKWKEKKELVQQPVAQIPDPTPASEKTGPVKPVPLSKIETIQAKVQPLQPLLNSGSNLKDKELYAMYAGVNIYDKDGGKVRLTNKNEYLGKLYRTEKMPNGVYWVYYMSGAGKIFKMPSNSLLVKA